MDAQSLLIDDPAGLARMPRPSMKDAIAEKLASLIGSGVLAVGDSLPAERELASAMGVSRETIRGALLILSTRGILSVVQGARTTVASDDVGDMALAAIPSRPVTSYELDDVHDARLLVEARIAGLVAARPDPDLLARLGDLIEAQCEATDPVRFLILDREFHTQIYRASGNAVLTDVATTLYSYLMDHRRRAVAQDGAIARSIADHRAILAALATGDGAGAAETFGIHERRIYETTRQLMARAKTNDDIMGGDPK
ncbi:MAG: FCD domain-containing protein [Pseudomonadota bacterium]